MLVADGEDRGEMVALLVRATRALLKEAGLETVQFLYCLDEEADELQEAGLASRFVFQFHFENRGFHTLEDWLATLPSKKRTQIRRERREPASQGIVIDTLRGDAMAAEVKKDVTGLARLAHALYRTTTDKYAWGRPYLNEAFFSLAMTRLPHASELVRARRDDALVAGAINFSSDTRLFGRYWGCFEELKFLHFNVALYHSVNDCIERGFDAFEAGAGGEHKLTRGFNPVFTHSAHGFLNPRLEEVMVRILAVESQHRQAELDRFRADKTGTAPVNEDTDIRTTP